MSIALAKKLPGGKLVICTASGTGPGADVSVGAGVAANIDVDVSFPSGLFNSAPNVVVAEISGLPDGVVLVGFSVASVDATKVTVRLRVYNPTSADITVTAGSVTVKVLAFL